MRRKTVHTKNKDSKDLVLILITAILFSTTFLLTQYQYSKESNPIHLTSYEVKAESSKKEVIDPIEMEIESMSLEEKVGLMFMGGYHKANYFDQQLALINEKNFVGVVLMRENVSSYSDTINSVRKVKELEKNLDRKILIGIDEEGGSVTRLYNQMPQQRSQTSIYEPQDAYLLSYQKGDHLAKIGINMNFAPVMDHIVKPSSFLYDRVFHADQETISLLAKEMIKGYRESGITAVPKHYPGHPDTPSDSHYNLPSSLLSKEAFEIHTKQFRKLIATGGAEAIMTGHVMFPAIDPKFPSTLSRVIIEQKLRGEYGFEGVVITDDMNMGALKNSYEFRESAILAVEAGNDILLYITEPRFQASAYDAVLKAVKSGRISEEKINKSVYRTLNMIDQK